MLATAPQSTSKLWLGILVGVAAIYAYFYFTRHDHFLDWSIASSTDRTSVTVGDFSLGPFSLQIPGSRYTISEEFVGSAVQDTSHITTPLLIIIWIGICYLLASFTFFKRSTFIILLVLFALFLGSLQLDGYRIFGLDPPSRIGTGIIIFLYLGLAYAFHAFLVRISFGIRWLSFGMLSSGLGIYLSTQIPQFPNYILATGTMGFSLMALLFVILVAEEIIYAFLFVVTQSRGKNGEKHFVLASIVYLLFLTLYYLKKAGIYPNTLAIIDPYLLLVISALVSVWSLKFKQEFFNTNTGTSIDLRHFLVGGGLIAFSYLSIGFAGGNDPLYESFHYLITYVHLGFGAAFFLYIVLNFIDALIAGHAVYKIAYKERNFPYLTCRLVGLIAVAAFFFQANREPLELTQAARYNALGEHAIKTNDGTLAQQYFIEGAVFGYNNHLSNYQLAIAAQYQGKTTEQAMRYRNATKRYPTPQAFANAAQSAPSPSESQVFLEEGAEEFPSSGELKNNLAVHYTENSRFERALTLLEEAGSTGDWNSATAVNKWKVYTHIGEGSDAATDEFAKGNPAVKTNMISYWQGVGQDLPKLDTGSFAGPLNLHDLTLLHNACYGPTNIPYSIIQHAIQFTYNVQLQNDLRIAGALNKYLSGDVNTAIQTLEGLLLNANPYFESEIANLLGLLFLEQGVFDQAGDHFATAAERGLLEARFHLAVTYMETGEWVAAQDQWQQLLSAQPRYEVTYNQIATLFSATPDQLLSFYYGWDRFTPSALVEGLRQASPAFMASVWKKISNRCITRWQAETYQDYLEAFESQLDAEALEKAQFALSVLQGKTPSNIPATNNAFDETRTIAQVMYLVDQGEEIAGFNLLAAASELYPSSITYLQRYCLMAIKLGLREYGEQGMNQLRELMSVGEYAAFSKEYQSALSAATDNF